MIRSAQFADQGAFPVDARRDHWSDYVRGALQYARNAAGLPVVSMRDRQRHSGWRGAFLIGCDDCRYAAGCIGRSFIGGPGFDQPPGKSKMNSSGALQDHGSDGGRAWPSGAAAALDTRDPATSLSMCRPIGSCRHRLRDAARAADGRYKERREECLAAAQALSVDLLCDADISAAVAFLQTAGRAPHVIAEGARSRRAIDAFKATARRSGVSCPATPRSAITWMSRFPRSMRLWPTH